MAMKTLALCSVAFVVFGLALSSQSPERAQLPTLTEIRLTDTVDARPGGGPEAITSDGTSIWVADQFRNSVTRINPLTGLRLGTFAVGRRPIALLAIGSALWVANLESDTLTQLRTSDGAVLGTF